VKLNLSEINRRHVREGRPLDKAIEDALRNDARPGAKAILAAVERRRSENRSEGQRLRRLLRFETELWAAGTLLVAGVDEAGMSPLAGPVCAAAVIFEPGTRIPGVDDSKKLDAAARARLAVEIKGIATAWSVGWAEVPEIDALNIYWAGILAMRRAVEGLSSRPDHVLLDARRIKELDIPQRPIVQGDAKSLTIAAASIIAKTSRDARMCELDAQYPGYGFKTHKGYPVPEHRVALEKLGATSVHRRSFALVRSVLGLPPLAPWPSRNGKSADGADTGCAEDDAYA
jgi:ribonuclease HII